MIVKIAILVLCLVALALIFKGELILKTVFKIQEPSEKAVMTLKLVALALAVLLFVVVFRV